MNMNFDAMDTVNTAINFDSLDTATRGKVNLILTNVTQKATQTGKMRLYFEFANESAQKVNIGIWADRANEFFTMCRMTLGIKEKGNAFVETLQKSYHTFYVRNDENGYPYIDFVEMKGDTV